MKRIITVLAAGIIGTAALVACDDNEACAAPPAPRPAAPAYKAPAPAYKAPAAPKAPAHKAPASRPTVYKTKGYDSHGYPIVVPVIVDGDDDC